MSQKQFSDPILPLTVPPIINRQSKHPLKPLDTRGSPLFITVRNNFRIGACLKTVAAILELFSQLLEVIDLSVENRAYPTISIEDWLMSTLQIDDAQTAHTNSDSSARRPSAFEITLVVRPTMQHRRRHPPDNCRRVARVSPINYSTNPTHTNSDFKN